MKMVLAKRAGVKLLVGVMQSKKVEVERAF